MESDRYANISNTDESMEWYSEDFISGNLVSYLKRNGYKIHDEKVKSLPLKTEKIITVSRFFTKEVIYIKGLQPLSERKILLEVFDKKDDLTQPRNWFYESFFNSFINFGKYYSDEGAVAAMTLPNVQRSKSIIEKVHDYFNSNNLYFKIYLINKSGEVEVMNLNEKESK